MLGTTAMNTGIQQLVNLGVTLVIALLVWRYYRNRTFPPSDRYSTFGPRFWTGSVDSCVLWPLGFITSTLLSLNIPTGSGRTGRGRGESRLARVHRPAACPLWTDHRQDGHPRASRGLPNRGKDFRSAS